MKLVIGLGNPERKYDNTRHNIGFRVVDALAEKYDGEWKAADKHKSGLAEVQIGGEKVLLVKPLTFMNLSGQTVVSLLNFYKVDPKTEMLIVTDDKDMLFGKLRQRSEGSSGGHNGLNNIIDLTGSDEFHRLKFGVGHEDQQIPTDAFVLQKFSAEEEEQLPELIDQAVAEVENWLGQEASTT